MGSREQRQTDGMIFLDSWDGRKRRWDNPACVYGYHLTQPTGWRPGGNMDTLCALVLCVGSLATYSLRGVSIDGSAMPHSHSRIPHRTPSLPQYTTQKLNGTGRTHNKRSLLLTRGPAPGSPRARWIDRWTDGRMDGWMDGHWVLVI